MIVFQLNRLADLEEIVAEQDKRLADSRQNLDRAKNESEKMKEANAVELKLQKKKLRVYVLIIYIEFCLTNVLFQGRNAVFYFLLFEVRGQEVAVSVEIVK